MLAPMKGKVTAIACHPKSDILAAGYSRGTVMLVRLNDGAEILARASDDIPVSALAWDAKGATLAFAPEKGAAGQAIVALPLNCTAAISRSETMAAVPKAGT